MGSMMEFDLLDMLDDDGDADLQQLLEFGLNSSGVAPRPPAPTAAAGAAAAWQAFAPYDAPPTATYAPGPAAAAAAAAAAGAPPYTGALLAPQRTVSIRTAHREVGALLEGVADALQALNSAAPGQVGQVPVLHAVHAASAHLSAWPMPAFGACSNQPGIVAGGSLAAAAGGSGDQQQQQQQQFMQPPVLQLVQQPVQQQQQLLKVEPDPSMPQQLQQQFMQQPMQQQQQQQRQPQRTPPKPSVSAATLAKAAALAGKPPPHSFTGQQQQQQAQAAQSAAMLQATTGPTGMLQAAASGGLPLAAAAAAPPLGFALPDQFKGVMLTPAGLTTGVAVGPGQLMHWVQGLQQLASQQQQATAARKKTPAGAKEKVAVLEAKVSKHQEQLQALGLENLALTAKVRALEQLVKSAGDDVTLMEEQLSSLSLRSDSSSADQQAALAAAAAVAALQGEGSWQQHALLQQHQQQQQQQRQHATPGATPSPVNSQQSQQQQQQQQQQQAAGSVFSQVHQRGLQELMDTPLQSLQDILGGVPGSIAAAAAAAAPQPQPQQPSPQMQPPQQQQHGAYSGSQQSPSTTTGPGGSACSGVSVSASGGDVTSPVPGSSAAEPWMQGNLQNAAELATAAATAAAAGTGGRLLFRVSDSQAGGCQEMFEAATGMAAHGVLPPVGAYRLGEKLPEIQALHKRVVLQLMPLLLQVQQERLDMQEAVHAAVDDDGRQQAASEHLLAHTPVMEELTRVMLQYSRDIHTFAIANRVSTYSLYTLNIETGVMGQPPPEGHWARVAEMLKDRLSPQALVDLCVSRQLYSCTVTKVKQQRQLLILRLAQLLSRWAARGYRTDAVFNDVAGPHCEGMLLLDAIDSNMRKEYTTEGVYQWMTHHIIPMHVLAELVVHSYPFKADVHCTLQELMRDQPMPSLTAVQQLQLKQLQEQQEQLLATAQQQALLVQQQQQQAAIAAAALVQQQAAAAALQTLQQQRVMLGVAAGFGGDGSFTSTGGQPGPGLAGLGLVPGGDQGSFTSAGGGAGAYGGLQRPGLFPGGGGPGSFSGSM